LAAWHDGEPHIAFGGATPAEAVDRLADCATAHLVEQQGEYTHFATMTVPSHPRRSAPAVIEMENRMHTTKLLIVAVTILATLVTVELWGQADAPAIVPPTPFRYQVSAWGTSTAHGAYIVDMSTGDVWYSLYNGAPKRIGSAGPQGDK
jgi:hypothetical protein